MPIYRIVVNEANYFNSGMVVNFWVTYGYELQREGLEADSRRCSDFYSLFFKK